MENNMKKPQEDKVLSLDELESVSGGYRDWSTQGCAATCEVESDCWGTDRCSHVNICYLNFPNKLCTYCARGDVEFIGLDADLMQVYRCKKCGFEKKYKGIEYTSAH